MSDLNISHEKMSFGFGFTVVTKLRKFDFKSHRDTSIFFDKKGIITDLNMSHGKVSDFVSFPLFRFTLVIKLKNFDFKIY